MDLSLVFMKEATSIDMVASLLGSEESHLKKPLDLEREVF
jgi:hypothetical protein